MGEALDLLHKLFSLLSPLIPWKSFVLLMVCTGLASTLPAAGRRAAPACGRALAASGGGEHLGAFWQPDWEQVRD